MVGLRYSGKLPLSKLNPDSDPAADSVSSVAWTSVTRAGNEVAKVILLLARLSAIGTVADPVDGTLKCGSTASRIAPDASKNMPSAK